MNDLLTKYLLERIKEIERLTKECLDSLKFYQSAVRLELIKPQIEFSKFELEVFDTIDLGK